MMAASGDGRQQQQVQYVLLHHGQLIGTASATPGESFQFQLHETGDEIEIGPTTVDGGADDELSTTATTSPQPITIVQLPATTSADHDGGNEELEEIANDDDVDADQRSTDVLMENSAVVLQCVEATDDDAYLECIGLDIDPGEEGDDPGGGGGDQEEEAPTVVESDDLGGQVDLQVQETVISMKNNNNDSKPNNNNTTVRTVLIPTSKRIQPDDADDDEVESRCTTSSSDGGSVLRTLLQANRRQLLMYQSHKHSSERIPFRGGRTTYSRRSEHQISHRQLNLAALANDDIFVGDGDVDVRLEVDDEGESRAAVAQIEPQAPEVAVSQRIDSQIKALLLGHNYVREGGGGLARNSTTTTSSSTTLTSCSAAVVRRRPISGMTASDEPSNANKKHKSRVSDYDDEPLLHPLFTEVLKVIAEFSDLNYSVQYGHRSTFLEVCRKGLYGIPSPGQTPVRVIVSHEGIAQFVSVVGAMDEVDCEIRGPTEPSVAERLRPLLHKLSIKSGHVYCPGIDQEYYSDSATSSTLLGACRVSESSSSFKRYRSKECEVWHSIVRGKQENQASTWLGLNEGVHKCHDCRKLDLYLKTLDKKKMAASPMSTTTTTSNTIATATMTTAKRSSIVERATAINVETGQEFICVWGSTEEMET